MSTINAIVLSLQPHSDKAHILHAYTREHGRVNYMVYGVGRKNPIGCYNPLSIIQITTSASSKPLASIRTANLTFIPSTIHTDPYKQTIVLFLSEILFHTLCHPMADEAIFDYIQDAICLLDEQTDIQDFHLQFLIHFAALLGFAIDEYTHPQLVKKPTSRHERQVQLRQLCEYMAEYIDNWHEPRSLDVLMEVFD